MTKILLSILLLSPVFYVDAQTLTYEDLVERGELGIDTAYSPKSLESMVGSSALIVKGRYGEFLGSKNFYGYKNDEELTKEEVMAEKGLTESDLKWIVLPVNEYEISVEEVLMGHVESNTLILRVGETTPTPSEFVRPDRERIFFLVRNPGNRTVVARSDVCILTADEGVYSYRSFVPPSRLFPIISYVNKPLDFMPSMEVEEFEEALRAQIAKGRN